jgi:hypothetical protein
MQTIEQIFHTLRKSAKAKCDCGNADFIAPLFHADGCPYKVIAEKVFLETYWNESEPINEKETAHASN